ncbi:MAG: cation:proton antiporter, partial [Deltaproteobacteria bacterium]|nr:cation:proton antiporter [Deltaproteobacteria bacterium]
MDRKRIVDFLKRRRRLLICSIALFVCTFFMPDLTSANGDGGAFCGSHNLLTSIGISIIAATLLAYLANMIKQPMLLAIIAAGAAIGPQFGLGLVRSKDDISIISEMGLILLLFMIGLELDLKKIREAGKSLIVTGIL